MNSSPSEDIESWESEGGSVPESTASSAPSMTGTPSQVEWAERIKQRVIVDFDRVEASFRAVAVKQDAAARADTEAVIAILEDKRAETLSRHDAGYYIHDWQEITDQVRQMIFRDNRYRTIKKSRAARYHLSGDSQGAPTKAPAKGNPWTNDFSNDTSARSCAQRKGSISPNLT